MAVRGVEGEPEREGGRVDCEACDGPADLVGEISTKASLGMMYVPLPYEMLAIGSLIVKSKFTLVVPPSLVTRSWNVCCVRFTVGVPHTVPLLAPSWSPGGRSGTKVQLRMLPSTS